MKFRFCGESDCPDWILGEIATISKISSIKTKQLTSFIIQTLLSNEELQVDKLTRLANDTKLTIEDIKASISLITFILTSATTHTCNSETLSNELQQLGLPKEHASAITKNYDDNQQKLEESLKSSSLRELKEARKQMEQL